MFPSFGTENFKELKFKDEMSFSGSFHLNILRNGCRIASQNISLESLSSSLVFVGLPALFNGFEIVPDEDSSFSFTGNIVLLGSNDNLTWTTAASSNFRVVGNGVRFLHGPSRRDPGLRYDFRPPWPLITDTVTSSILFALGCIGTALSGAYTWLCRVDTNVLGKSVFLGFAVALSIHSFAVGAGYLCISMPNYAFVPLSQGAVFLLIAAVLHFREAFFFDTLRSVALFSIACRVVSDCAFFDDSGNLLADPPVQSLAFFVVGSIFASLRRRFLLTAVSDVGSDRASLDAVWARLQADPDERGALERLAAAAAAAAISCVPVQARQLNRARRAARREGSWARRWIPAPTGWPPNGSAAWPGDRAPDSVCLTEGTGLPGASGENAADGTEPGEVDVESPVMSLDQLYSQVRGWWGGRGRAGH